VGHSSTGVYYTMALLDGSDLHQLAPLPWRTACAIAPDICSALCAPESLHLQALDARTVLFGLGATLYFMLVGTHAYPTRQFSQLHETWQASLLQLGSDVHAFSMRACWTPACAA
jgi:hypothetical protein